MYLLFRGGGHYAQEELWRWQTSGRLVLHNSTKSEMARMAELMNTYRDRPMDLADASLIATAEHFGTKCLFTLDSDFYIYRLLDGSVLECVP